MDAWRQRLDESLEALSRDPEPLARSPAEGNSTGPLSTRDDSLLAFGVGFPGASPRNDETLDPEFVDHTDPLRDRVPEQTTTRPARQNAYISLSAVPDLATTTTSTEPQAADHPLRSGVPNNVVLQSPPSISPAPHRVLTHFAQQPMAAVPKARAHVQAAPDLQGSLVPAKAKAIAHTRRADTGGSDTIEVATDVPPPYTIPDIVGFNFRQSAGGPLVLPKTAQGVTTRRAPPNGRGTTTTMSSMVAPLRQLFHNLDPPGRSHHATDGDAAALSATWQQTPLEMPVAPGSSWERLATLGSSRTSPEVQAVSEERAANMPAESAYATDDTSQQASNSNTVPIVRSPETPGQTPGGDLGEGVTSFPASRSSQNGDTRWLHERPHHRGSVETAHYSAGSWEASHRNLSVEEGFGEPQEEREGAEAQGAVQDGQTRQYRAPSGDSAFEPLYVPLPSWWTENGASGLHRHLPTSTDSRLPSEVESNRDAWTANPSTMANTEIVVDDVSTHVDRRVVHYTLSPRVNTPSKPPYPCAEDADKDCEEIAVDCTTAGEALDDDDKWWAQATDAAKRTDSDTVPYERAFEGAENSGTVGEAGASDKKENVGYFKAIWRAQKEAAKSVAPAQVAPGDSALRRFDDMWKSKHTTTNAEYGHAEAVRLSSPTAESRFGIGGQEPLIDGTDGARAGPAAPNPENDYIHTYESVLWKHHAPTRDFPRNPLSELPLQDANEHVPSNIASERINASEERADRLRGEGAWETYQRLYLNSSATLHTANNGTVKTSQPENTLNVRPTSLVWNDPTPGRSYEALNSHYPDGYTAVLQASGPSCAWAHNSESEGSFRAADASTARTSMWATTSTNRSPKDNRRADSRDAESSTAYIVSSLNRDSLRDNVNAGTTQSARNFATARAANESALGSARSLLSARRVENRTEPVSSTIWKDDQSHDRFIKAHDSLRNYFQNRNPFDSLKLPVDAAPTLPSRRNQYGRAVEVAGEARRDDVLIHKEQDVVLRTDMAERGHQDYESSQRRVPVSRQPESPECRPPLDGAFEAATSPSVMREPSRIRHNEPRTWVAPRNHFDGSVSTDWASRRPTSPEHARPASARLNGDRISSPFACSHRAVRTAAHRTAARRYVARTFGDPNSHSPDPKTQVNAVLPSTSAKEEDERLLAIKSRFAGLRQTLHGLLQGEMRVPALARTAENGAEKMRRPSSLRGRVSRIDTTMRLSKNKASRENPRSRAVSKV